jgi:hypothetical protein
MQERYVHSESDSKAKSYVTPVTERFFEEGVKTGFSSTQKAKVSAYAEGELRLRMLRSEAVLK